MDERTKKMMTSEERVQKVLDALLPLSVGARVRVLSCDHQIEPGSISDRKDCAGLYHWMVGATGTIDKYETGHGGAYWLVKFDKPSSIDRWWVGAHQIELL